MVAGRGAAHRRLPLRSKSTAAQLRRDIDLGLTGDKVAVEDPAAAPLGTDDEAAGTPPDPEMMAQVRERELKTGDRVRRASRNRDSSISGAIPWLLIAAFLLSLLAFVWLGVQYIEV
ncbi:MAG: hypothetical protein KJZ80_09520 [Hyphomicrobiaceae bacterium]|nr:hypothetical protein [Hyphomicrobiaceae bacterium]